MTVTVDWRMFTLRWSKATGISYYVIMLITSARAVALSTHHTKQADQQQSVPSFLNPSASLLLPPPHAGQLAYPHQRCDDFEILSPHQSKDFHQRSATASAVVLDRLRNDLYCVEWDVKLYYTIPYRSTGSAHSTPAMYNATFNKGYGKYSILSN